MKARVTPILAAALLLCTCLSRPHLLRPAELSPDTPMTTHPLAPELSVTDLQGQRLDLAAYRGKVVLLDFWATWCAPCRAEIPRLVDLQKRYQNKGMQIIGISLDDQTDPVRAFYKRFKMNYRVAMGDADLAERYGGILGLPVCFLIDCDGRIHARYDGQIDVSLIELEIKLLLGSGKCTQGLP